MEFTKEGAGHTEARQKTMSNIHLLVFEYPAITALLSPPPSP